MKKTEVFENKYGGFYTTEDEAKRQELAKELIDAVNPRLDIISNAALYNFLLQNIDVIASSLQGYPPRVWK